MTKRFIAMTEVRRRVALSKTEIYRKIAAGAFPRPIPLGAHRVGWLESEVEGWMTDRLAAREEGEGAARRAEQGRRAVAARGESNG